MRAISGIGTNAYSIGSIGGASRSGSGSQQNHLGGQSATSGLGSEVSQKRRMLSSDQKEKKSKVVHAESSGSILSSMKSYGEKLKTDRAQTKDTGLELKKLKYQFKDISSKIIRSKTSNAAKQALSQAKREVLRLKRAKQNENYDSEEVEAALAHAKAMERVAKKKVKHLQEEEMAGAAARVTSPIELINEQEEKESSEDAARSADESEAVPDEVFAEEEPLSEDFAAEEYVSDEYGADTSLQYDAVEEMSALLEQVEEFTTETYEALSDAMKDMLSDLGLDELVDEVMTADHDMDPQELKELKIKHRNKEMKEMVKADAEYLKAYFDHLEKQQGSGTPGLGSASSVGGSATGFTGGSTAAAPVTMPGISNSELVSLPTPEAGLGGGIASSINITV